MALLLSECSIIRSNGRRWSKSFQTSLRFCSTGELSRRNDGVYVERIMLVMVCSFFALVRRVGSFDRLAQRSGCSAVRSFDCSVVWLCGVPSFSIEFILPSVIMPSVFSSFFSTSCRFTVIFTFVPCVFYRSRFPFVRVISLFDLNVMVGERWVGLVSGLSVTRTYNLLGLGSYLR